jgi:dynactin complex subunit
MRLLHPGRTQVVRPYFTGKLSRFLSSLRICAGIQVFPQDITTELVILRSYLRVEIEDNNRVSVGIRSRKVVSLERVAGKLEEVSLPIRVLIYFRYLTRNSPWASAIHEGINT